MLYTVPRRWLLPTTVPLGLVVGRMLVDVDVPVSYTLITMAIVYVIFAEFDFWERRKKA